MLQQAIGFKPNATLCVDPRDPGTQNIAVGNILGLHRLLDESPKVLVQDWYKTDQTRRIVRSAMAEVLDRELPKESYDRALFQTKCDNVFHLVLDLAAQGHKWAA